MNRLLDKYLPLREGEGTGSGASAPEPVITPVAPAETPASPPSETVATPTVEGAPREGEAEAPAPLSAADIMMPEGFTADEAQMKAFLDIANNAELDPKARANALTNLYAEGVKKMQESLAADWIARNKKWADEIRTDAEIGGQNMQTSETLFANTLAEFGDEQLTKDLIESGMGNRLSFARFLVKVGKVMSEGKPLVGDPTSDAATDRASKLYPNQGKV